MGGSLNTCTCVQCVHKLRIDELCRMCDTEVRFTGTLFMFWFLTWHQWSCESVIHTFHVPVYQLSPTALSSQKNCGRSCTRQHWPQPKLTLEQGMLLQVIKYTLSHCVLVFVKLKARTISIWDVLLQRSVFPQVIMYSRVIRHTSMFKACTGLLWDMALEQGLFLQVVAWRMSVACRCL